LRFDYGLHGIAEQSIINFCVVIEIIGHEGDGKLRNSIGLVIEGSAIDLDDWRIALNEHYKVVNDICQEEDE
jgi:hypothetical protein